MRVAVIGYGYWGPNITRNVAEVDGAELVAVCDTSDERLLLAERRHRGVATFRSPDRVFRDDDVDAVAITTPPHTHYSLARAALESGKHVLVTKPIADTLAGAEDLVCRADAAERVLMVDHTFVYTGAVRKIRELIAAGELGDLYYVDSTRLNLGLVQGSVDVLWDLAPHDLSILLHATGAMPLSVIAVGSRFVGSQFEVAYLVLKLHGGAVAHVSVSWLAPVKVRTTIFAGSNKMIIYDDMEVVEKVRVYDSGVAVDSPPTNPHDLLVQYRMGDIVAPKLDLTEALKVEVEHFVDCVVSGAEPITSARTGVAIVRILEAASLSMANGGTEVELWPKR